MPSATASPVYAYEQWEIDLGRRELRAHGRPIVLGGRAFEILQTLARAQGELVTKDDLMARLWPGVIVGDNTIEVHISAVRKALGADRGLLKTTKGRGYRLIGGWGVRPDSDAAAEPPPVARSHRRSGNRAPTNFPVSVSPLVGRAGALQRIGDLVSAYRLVTLAGPGGIGKTVLALEAVRDLAAEFEDGACLVELASLSDPALAPSAVAAALELRFAGEQVTAEALGRGIGDRHLLLVLDNCEHLIDAVAALAETVMRLCPCVTVLATSREIMRMQGEAVYRVPALDVPPVGQEDGSLAHSAVALFVARAQALDTGFSPRAEDLHAIAEICRHLDGIPLALELAAARAALIGIEQVVSGLRDRFALLSGGRRTIPRHRTLRAALDWSYRLLSADEQRLLRHLAIFPAGFTFEAAQAVGGTGPTGPSILEALSSLVSKSLCERIDPAPVTRWRLLETIRTYGLERLAERGEYPSAARHHAGYFRDLVSPIAAGPATSLSLDDVSRCGREIDNVRAALDWAFSAEGDAETGAMLTAAFAPIWQTLSLMGECRDRVERLLRPGREIGLADTRLSQMTELRLWIAYGEALTMTMGPLERTREVVRKAMDFAAGIDDAELQAGLLYMQWSLEHTSGEHAAALAAAHALIAVTSRSGDTVRLAGDSILGTSLLYEGKLADAQDHLQRVAESYVPPAGAHHLALFRRDRRVLSRARLACVLGLRGQLDRAWAEARASVAAARSSDAGITICWAAQDALCPIALMRGDLAAADEAAAAMGDWGTRMNATLWKMMATCWQGRLLIERGDAARGIDLISPMLEACERTGWQLGYAEFLGCAADGLTRLGRFEEAGARLERALAWADRSGQAWYRPELLRLKGELLLHRSPGLSEECFQTAADLARAQGALFWELRIALSLARLRLSHGRHDAARHLLAPVYGRFTEGFDAPLLREAKSLLAGT